MIATLRTHPRSHTALIETTPYRAVTYGDLVGRMDAIGLFLKGCHPDRAMIILLARPSIDTVVTYLACLSVGYPVALLEDTFVRMVEQYGYPPLILPEAVRPPGAYRHATAVPGTTLVFHTTGSPWIHPMHERLALLMTTSGSTGSPKLVRLTPGNLSANASSISTYLGLTERERSVQSLPLYYSYGLSLLNSHLWCGGSSVFTPHSFIRKPFWEDVDTYRVTSFAGVPYMYEVLYRMKFDFRDHASIGMLTQSGGVLRRLVKQHFYEQMKIRKKKFFAMYGQVEATTRISYVPPHMLDRKIDSIGVPIPGGTMRLEKHPSGVDELVYTGPNVMLGYATDVASLSEPDRCMGTVRTGDAARVDDDGYYYHLGRIKHFAKLFGKGVNLMEVEKKLADEFRCQVAAVDTGDEEHIHIFVEGDDKVRNIGISRFLTTLLHVPPRSVRIHSIAVIPRTPSQKVDYPMLLTHL